MLLEDGHAANWRDASSYAPLLGADRTIFAWEWLRRDERYRAAACRALEGVRENSATGDRQADARRWGLHAFEWPCRTGPAARPMWRAGAHPYVIEARACREAPAGAFRFDRLAGRASIITASGREHILFSDGLRTIRLDVIGSLAGSPLTIEVRLGDPDAAEKVLLAARRLLALWRTGEFPNALYPREARAGRWLLMLRAHDAIAAGASQRDIAAGLLSPDSLRPRWRADAPSLRSRVQRLVRAARAMAADYRMLLR